ncbi:SGNH/GDSL hydrolase family protein [Methylorubrum extorquens]|uniref:SGNH/GDSL hydrolase family protein n=1 Tax=Methylorubrum extorquens TaxID=408 RepID=UPI00223813F6|nr:SGNH/GDSL hydrolase family protein [Methylorubrum extorquens]UYW30163.1 GDSL-type esterase/lipase family protein [Methylorubrum extorquens]
MRTCNATIDQKSYTVNIDENGFIRNGTQKRPDTPAIMILGDSVVENFWSEENERICPVVERALEKEGHFYRVINCGVTGASTLHLVNVLINKGVPLAPKAVVLLSGAIDAMLSMKDGGLWSNALTDQTSEHPRPKFDLSERGRALGILDVVCRELSVPLWLATFPFTPSAANCYGMRHFENKKDLLKNLLATNAQTASFAAERNLGFIDFANAIGNEDAFFYDGLHPNKIGREALGNGIASAILSHLTRDKNMLE